MSERLIIDGNAVYELDEDCLRQQEAKRRGRGGQRRGRVERQSCQEYGQMPESDGRKTQGKGRR